MTEINIKNKKRKIETKWIFYGCMMALPLLQFVVFYVVVNFNSFVMAFQSYNKLEGFQAAGFANFKRFFQEWKTSPVIWTCIKNSLIYFATSIVITIPLTLIFAYYIFKKFIGGEFFKVILFLPGVISSMLFVMFFKYCIDYVVPDIVQMRTGELISSPLAKNNPSFWLLLFFNLWIGFAGTILLYVNAMTQISPSILEAAKIDGASELRSFASIVIPSIWPTLVSFLVIALAGIASNQANLYSFYDRDVHPDVQTLGYYQFMLVWKNGNIMDDYPYASAVGLFFTLIVAPATIIVRNLLTKYGPRED